MLQIDLGMILKMLKGFHYPYTRVSGRILLILDLLNSAYERLGVH